jgi:DNA-binding MarR family transcriptional regulator
LLRFNRSISRSRRNAAIDTERTAAVDEVIAGYEGLMHRMAGSHAPEFLEIAVTMPQAKLLYLLGAAGELHMSELVARLGVSLSTVSGLVDRIVEAGLAARRDDPADRRQVVVALTPAGHDLIDRFRELNARGMRDLLARLDDAELDSVRAALAALLRAAERTAALRGPAADSPSVPLPARKDPA